MIASIDGSTFGRMIMLGAALLEQNKKNIDALNVFPVPDGDTGTNMSMTIASAVKEVKKTTSNSIGEVADALSLGALKGARGNSGVILSQLFRGFAKALSGVDAMKADDLARALLEGVDSAYKAVMKPKEGTMLTIARATAKSVQSSMEHEKDMAALLTQMLAKGEETLEMTPEMLPVLKEAGVVDAGGKGLLAIYRGFLMALQGDASASIEDMLALEPQEETGTEVFGGSNDLENITFAYCTEFFVQHIQENVDEAMRESFRMFLDEIGDSVVYVGDRGMIKVHVHTNSPGEVLQRALLLGEIDGIKIENMLEQHREMMAQRKAREKPYGMIAVGMGDGIHKVFQELGVMTVVPGGQTMNPSTEELLNAIDATPAKIIFFLPNNKNIILAARQAAHLSEKKTFVIPTKSVPQGIAAALSFHPDMAPEENEMRMINAMGKVRSGSVTYAVRDSQTDGLKVAQGDIIGLNDGKILEKGADVKTVVKALIARMLSAGGDLITLFYGADVNPDDAQAFKEQLESEHPDAEFLLQDGGQPLYYYLFSVE